MKKITKKLLSPTPILAKVSQALAASTTVGVFYFNLLPENWKPIIGVIGFILIFALQLTENKK